MIHVASLVASHAVSRTSVFNRRTNGPRVSPVSIAVDINVVPKPTPNRAARWSLRLNDVPDFTLRSQVAEGGLHLHLVAVRLVVRRDDLDAVPGHHQDGHHDLLEDDQDVQDATRHA